MAEEKDDKEDDKDRGAKTINPREDPIFLWEAPEFHVFEKGGNWTVIIFLVAIAMIGTFIWLKNWTGIALVIAGVAALVSQGFIKPKPIRCAIFDGGIVINDKPYNFSELKSFWMFDMPMLVVRFEKASRFSMPLTMPLGKMNAEQVRLYLAKKLPEHEERGEDLSDRISRWLRF